MPPFQCDIVIKSFHKIFSLTLFILMLSEIFGILMGCHFPYGVLGQVWYLIVSIPDLYLLSYFFYKSICPGRLFYILANSEDPGQMPHAAFHLGLNHPGKPHVQISEGVGYRR